MTPRRATLRDRNREAIAANPVAMDADEKPGESITPTPPSAQPATTTAHSVAATPAGTTPAARVPLSISVRPEDLELAKAAYMADWMREGRYDGFPKWLGAAIRQHAALTPNERAEIEARRPPKQTSRGLKRAFLMDPRDLEVLRQGLRDDLATGRYESEANWCADAMRVAVERARDRSGGALPKAPSRLPNRMPERN